jgi:PilZ domain-containing protein
MPNPEPRFPDVFLSILKSSHYDDCLGPIACLYPRLGQRIADRPLSGISPKKANSMETRKHARVPIKYVASFSGKKSRVSGVVLDLSVAGCRARSATEFNTGEYLDVFIYVPRYVAPLHAALAVVRWSHDQQFGMEFIQMERDDQQRLSELIRMIETAKALRQDTETQ